MIEQLVVQNFQSHKDTTINFDKGVNVITGASDAGKSSILRSLLWVIKNRPTGNSIHNWESNKWTQVTIVTEEGAVIKERQSGKALYSLISPDSDTVNFEAVKTDVPEEIQNLLNISDINIQTQHQPYFLLSESSGEIARKLNEFVGLDIIDSLFKNVNGRITSTRQLITETTSDIETKEEHLKKYKHIDKVVKEIELLEKRACELEKKQEWAVETEKCKERMVEQKELIDDCKEWLKVKNRYKKMEKSLSKYEEDFSSVLAVENIVSQMIRNKEERDELEDKIIILKEKRRDFFSFNRICPTCGQTLDKNQLERMLKQL